MGSVFRETMRGHRVGLASVSLGLFVMSLIIVYTFDALGGLEAFEDLYESLPDAFAAMFRAQGGFGSTLTNYIAADYRHPVYIVAGLAFVISASSGAVAREIERGTALMLLSSPIPRWRYLASKMLTMGVGVVIITFMAWLGSYVGTILTGVTASVDTGVLLVAQVNMLALFLAAGGISMLLSALSSDGGKTVLLSAAIITVMYFVDFVAAIWSPMEPIAPFGLFALLRSAGHSAGDGQPNVEPRGAVRRGGSGVRGGAGRLSAAGHHEVAPAGGITHRAYRSGWRVCQSDACS